MWVAGVVQEHACTEGARWAIPEGRVQRLIHWGMKTKMHARPDSSQGVRCRTGSSQTVCQMPELAVYQMVLPPGTVMRCLPMGMWADSVGSHTRTMSSCTPAVPLASASVMSYENLSYLQHCSALHASGTHCLHVEFLTAAIDPTSICFAFSANTGMHAGQRQGRCMTRKNELCCMQQGERRTRRGAGPGGCR